MSYDQFNRKSILQQAKEIYLLKKKLLSIIYTTKKQ